MADVLVFGCGLIGTSIGLSLRGEADVLLHDLDPEIAAEAVARGGGRLWDGSERVTTVVAAVPPGSIAGALKQAQSRDLGRTYTHVSSVQSQVQHDIEALDLDLSAVVGGHPLAGRESSGPGAATGDLFVGRPWALCPSPASSTTALRDVRALAQGCGAVAVDLDAEAHDSAVALLSHLPQVVASALAGQLVAASAAAAAPTVLSGPGLVDTTRLAASDPALWTEILRLNALHVAPVVRALAEQLAGLAQALEGPQVETAVRAFLERGNRGRALVPVKRGEVSDAFGRVRVSVTDQPGRLAALLTAAGAAGVNVEDVHVEHIQGRPQGVIELLIDVAAVPLLSTSLESAGWKVLGG